MVRFIMRVSRSANNHSLTSLLSDGNQYAASSQWCVDTCSKCALTVAASPARIASHNAASESATGPLMCVSPSPSFKNTNMPPIFVEMPSSSFFLAPADAAYTASNFSRSVETIRACRDRTRDTSALAIVASAGGLGHSGAGPTHAPPLQYFSRPRREMGGAPTIGGNPADAPATPEDDGCIGLPVLLGELRPPLPGVPNDGGTNGSGGAWGVALAGGGPRLASAVCGVNNPGCGAVALGWGAGTPNPNAAGCRG
mmetsp:Transcript_2965/g.11672  ORF Transcript_2965/g.11672 Transcript_2965/m.11672 type:complete len:255 (-) Transcript_2965:29-793(-)